MEVVPLKLHQFGSTHCKLVIYFHGAPGAPEEGQLFDLEAKKHGLTVLCLDRFAIHPSITGEAYYRLLAEEIAKKAGGQPVDFIGFSIGAFIALQTCRYMPNGVRSLHLVSAAAPLEAGNFLPAMAGQQVFRLVKAAPALFLLLSYWQSLLARLGTMRETLKCLTLATAPAGGDWIRNAQDLLITSASSFGKTVEGALANLAARSAFPRCTHALGAL